MMVNFILLATEAAHEGGFGINFNIFEANLINLGLLLGILFYFGSKVVGDVLSARSSRIAQAISEAEQRQKQAAAALAEQQQNLTEAQTKAEEIRKAAQESAKAVKESILAQAAKDIERLKETAQQDLNSEQERVMLELKQRIAAMALEQVESDLNSRLDNDEAQQTLINRSLAQLGGN